jgi:protein ImuA
MSLDDLLRRAAIWRGGELSPMATRPTGFTVLDEILPGRGWPQAGLTEIYAATAGMGTLRLVLPALAALSRLGHWVIWINPPHVPYAPALQEHGFDLARLLVVELPGQPGAAHDETLWAYEQALRFADCGAALAWFGDVPSLQLRRLQLAAEAGATWGLAFRPVQTAVRASPALLRLVLEVGATDTEAVLATIEVTLLKARGGYTGRQCRLEV